MISNGWPALRAAALPAIILLLIGLANPAPLRAEADPQEFLAQLQSDVIEQLTGGGISEVERERRFRTLFKRHFDTETIGRFVLGRYWRRSDPADQAAFLEVFEDIMVQRFLPLLGDRPDVSFVFGQARRDSRNEDMVLVASQVPRPDAEPFKVVWRLKEEGDSYRILDIVPEGVSMALTFRSEYGSFIKANGGDLAKLVAELREKVARGAFQTGN